VVNEDICYVIVLSFIVNTAVIETLGVVGVECSTSETARWTSKGRKIGTWCICNARKASPQGWAHIWVVFSCKGAERDECRGPKGRADALALVVLCRKDDRAAKPIGPSRGAHFRGVIKNAKFQRSSSRHRVFPREPIRHSVVDCPLCSHSFAANHITAF